MENTVTKIQLSTIVSPETKQAYARLIQDTGFTLTSILTAAVPLLERYYQQAELIAGYISLTAWGDLSPSAACPECNQPFGELPWIAIRANGATCAPVCARCATCE